MYKLNAGSYIDDSWGITVGDIGPIGRIGHIGHVPFVSVGHMGGAGYFGPSEDYGGTGISYGFPFAGGLSGGALLSDPYYGGYSGYGYPGPGYAPYPYFYSY